MLFTQGLQEKFCKVEQNCFGARGQTETFLNIEDLRWKYKQTEAKNEKIQIKGHYGYGDIQRFTGPFLVLRAPDRYTDWTLFS